MKNLSKRDNVVQCKMQNAGILASGPNAPHPAAFERQIAKCSLSPLNHLTTSSHCFVSCLPPLPPLPTYTTQLSLPPPTFSYHQHVRTSPDLTYDIFVSKRLFTLRYTFIIIFPFSTYTILLNLILFILILMLLLLSQFCAKCRIKIF